MRSKFCIAAAAALVCLAAGPAWAGGYYTCNGKRLPPGVDDCPDGSIAMFHAEDVPQVRPPAPVKPDRRTAQPAPSLFGVWRTKVPGAVWESPGSRQGYNRLNVAPGARAGDLVIHQDGRYTWNSYGGKKGRWMKGDDPAYPIVLIDTVENKLWRVGWDRDHLVVWDGSIWYFGQR